MKAISIGDKVRSFDFAGNRNLSGESACYIEGVVEEITTPSNHEVFRGCARYGIRVQRRIFGGVECDGEKDTGALVFPPVNGTLTVFGGLTCFVEKQ